MFYQGLVIGMFIGAFLGVVLLALLIAGRDHESERAEEDESRD